MLGKAHNPSGRIVRGRIACPIVILCTLLGTGSAHAGTPPAGAIGGGAIASVGTTGANTATGAVAPVGRAATQALAAQPNPATNPAAQAPAVAVTPPSKAPMPAAADSVGVAPLAKSATQTAAAAVTPPAKAAMQSAGQILGPVSKAATQALAPTVQGAARVVAPASGLIHRETSSGATARNALATVIQRAAGTATPILTPAITAGAKLTSAPQGAPAALRGAIGALGGALWSAASGAPVSGALDSLGSSLRGLELGPGAHQGTPGTLAHLAAVVMSALPRAPMGAWAGKGGAGTSGSAVAAAFAQLEAASGRLAGAPGCALSERCSAPQPPGPSFPARSPWNLGAPCCSTLAGSMARAALGGSGGARADPRSGLVAGSVPSPAPGGASGSAAAFGFAALIFLALASVLLSQAPGVMGRLRLPREPWLVARFVLVPERPG